jgi:hypothetical protein
MGSELRELANRQFQITLSTPERLQEVKNSGDFAIKQIQFSAEDGDPMPFHRPNTKDSQI